MKNYVTEPKALDMLKEHKIDRSYLSQIKSIVDHNIILYSYVDLLALVKKLKKNTP